MIHRGEGEIRVERVEWLMWTENLMGAAAFLALAGIFAFTGDVPPYVRVLIVLGIVVASTAFFVTLLRKRGVCIIRPDRIGHGSLDGALRWIPREQVGSVEISRTPFFQLDFYDPSGKWSGTTSFMFFSDQELVEAFESAGIPVKAPRAVRGQVRRRREEADQ